MRRIIVVVGLVSVVGALALGCDNGGGGEDEDILVGTITSLTGDLGGLGPSWRDAAKLAVQEASAAGGLLGGRDLKLLVEDDRTTPDGGRAAAEKLVAEQVVGVIGCPASGSTLAAVEVTGPAEIPQISGTSTSPELNAGDEDPHPYFFRSVPADDLQGFVLGSAAAGEYNDADLDLDCQRLAVVNIDNNYGNPFGDAVAERFAGLGRTVAIDIDYPESLSSYADQVDDIIAATPDCIALVAYPDTGSIIVREYYSRSGPEGVIWFGTDGLKNDDFMEQLSATARAGFVGSAPASNPDRPQLRAFNELYTATFGGEQPQVFADLIYDGSALLVLAIAQAGSTTGSAVRDALFQVSSGGNERYGPGEIVNAINAIQGGIDVNYEGAGGPQDFLPNGDVVADYEIWEYDGSAFVTRASVTAESILTGMAD